MVIELELSSLEATHDTLSKIKNTCGFNATNLNALFEANGNQLGLRSDKLNFITFWPPRDPSYKSEVDTQDLFQAVVNFSFFLSVSGYPTKILKLPT